jgi:hypothetical protein
LLGGHDASKPKQTKTMQWNTFCDKKKLMINVIHVTISKGKFKDEEVLIPRTPMIPTDMPFEFK